VQHFRNESPVGENNGTDRKTVQHFMNESSVVEYNGTDQDTISDTNTTSTIPGDCDFGHAVESKSAGIILFKSVKLSQQLPAYDVVESQIVCLANLLMVELVILFVFMVRKEGLDDFLAHHHCHCIHQDYYHHCC
jgi:hypothetical protein